MQALQREGRWAIALRERRGALVAIVVVEEAHSLGWFGRSFLVDEGVELVVVEILEFELALGDFGTWRPRRVTLDLIGGELQVRAYWTKTVLFKQFFLGV